ncbi:MAG TPA: 23S ribosomal RNA methyltransferase Erm [Ktedonobacterales bacterium]|nr:23S ribosomal RNA methyltransferase Erm [Ktedonobacterales bacterium]
MSTSSSRPSIRHSQNFLHDPALVTRLLDKCHLEPDDVVYEIGPGKGILTEQLARRCGRVVAIEKDPCLAEQLARRFAAQPNVTIHRGDFLDYHLPRAPYKVVANIPFNITADIVTKLTSAACPPDDAYLVMQREAADMLLGTPRTSLRATLLSPWFETEIVHRFRRTDFMPAPRVDVVMLRMRKRGPPLVSRRDEQCFRDFVVYVFTAWQPTIGTTLTSLFTPHQLRYVRTELGLDLDRTPTSIPFEQWLRLFEYFMTVRDNRAMQAIAGSEHRLLRQQQRLQKIHRTRACTT